jgi:hypothetical protein
MPKSVAKKDLGQALRNPESSINPWSNYPPLEGGSANEVSQGGQNKQFYFL